MLPPTSERLRDPATVPYFLWDTGMTVGEVRAVLASSDTTARDAVLVRVLREANTRDAWLFLDWSMIDEAWERIAPRLGRARPVWTLLRDAHARHDLARAG